VTSPALAGYNALVSAAIVVPLLIAIGWQLQSRRVKAAA
jgi:hypothetical protein